MSVFTAQAKMRELKQRLQLTMPSAVMTDSLDVNGFQATQILYKSEIAIFKIVMDSNQGRVDGLNLPQQSYSPHIAELLQDSDINVAAAAELKARMSAAMGKMGIKLHIKADIQVNLIAAGAPGFDAAYAAAAEVVTLRSDEINPLTQSS